MSEPDSWIIHLAAGGRLNWSRVGWLRHMVGPGALEFVESCGRDDVVDEF